MESKQSPPTPPGGLVMNEMVAVFRTRESVESANGPVLYAGVMPLRSHGGQIREPLPALGVARRLDMCYRCRSVYLVGNDKPRCYYNFCRQSNPYGSCGPALRWGGTQAQKRR